jgi:hypothetical protein
MPYSNDIIPHDGLKRGGNNPQFPSPTGSFIGFDSPPQSIPNLNNGASPRDGLDESGANHGADRNAGDQDDKQKNNSYLSPSQRKNNGINSPGFATFPRNYTPVNYSAMVFDEDEQKDDENEALYLQNTPALSRSQSRNSKASLKDFKNMEDITDAVSVSVLPQLQESRSDLEIEANNNSNSNSISHFAPNRQSSSHFPPPGAMIASRQRKVTNHYNIYTNDSSTSNNSNNNNTRALVRIGSGLHDLNTAPSFSYNIHIQQSDSGSEVSFPQPQFESKLGQKHFLNLPEQTQSLTQMAPTKTHFRIHTGVDSGIKLVDPTSVDPDIDNDLLSSIDADEENMITRHCLQPSVLLAPYESDQNNNGDVIIEETENDVVILQQGEDEVNLLPYKNFLQHYGTIYDQYQSKLKEPKLKMLDVVDEVATPRQRARRPQPEYQKDWYTPKSSTGHWGVNYAQFLHDDDFLRESALIKSDSTESHALRFTTQHVDAVEINQFSSGSGKSKSNPTHAFQQNQMFTYMNDLIVNYIIHDENLNDTCYAIQQAQYVRNLMEEFQLQYPTIQREDSCGSRLGRQDGGKVSKVMSFSQYSSHLLKYPTSGAHDQEPANETQPVSDEAESESTQQPLIPYPSKHLSGLYLSAWLTFIAYFCIFAACDTVSSIATSIFKSSNLLSSAMTYIIAIACALSGPIMVDRANPLLLVSILSGAYTLYIACNFTVKSVIVGGFILGLGGLMGFSNSMFTMANANYIAEQDMLAHVRENGPPAEEDGKVDENMTDDGSIKKKIHGVETEHYISTILDRNGRVIRPNLTEREQARLKFSTDNVIQFCTTVVQISTNLGSILGSVCGFCVLYFMKKPDETLTASSPLVRNLFLILLGVSVIGNIIFFVGFGFRSKVLFVRVGTKSQYEAELEREGGGLDAVNNEEEHKKLPIIPYLRVTLRTALYILLSRPILLSLFSIFSCYSVAGFISGTFVSKSGMLDYIGIEFITLYSALISVFSCLAAFLLSKFFIINTPQRARVYFAIGILLQAITVIVLLCVPVSSWTSKQMAWGICTVLCFCAGFSSCISGCALSCYISFLAYDPILRSPAFALNSIVRSLGLFCTFMMAVYVKYETQIYILLAAFILSLSLQIINCITQWDLNVPELVKKVNKYKQSLALGSESTLSDEHANNSPKQSISHHHTDQKDDGGDDDGDGDGNGVDTMGTKKNAPQPTIQLVTLPRFNQNGPKNKGNAVSNDLRNAPRQANPAYEVYNGRASMSSLRRSDVMENPFSDDKPIPIPWHIDMIDHPNLGNYHGNNRSDGSFNHFDLDLQHRTSLYGFDPALSQHTGGYSLQREHKSYKHSDHGDDDRDRRSLIWDDYYQAYHHKHRLDDDKSGHLSNNDRLNEVNIPTTPQLQLPHHDDDHVIPIGGHFDQIEVKPQHRLNKRSVSHCNKSATCDNVHDNDNQLHQHHHPHITYQNGLQRPPPLVQPHITGAAGTLGMTTYNPGLVMDITLSPLGSVDSHKSRKDNKNLRRNSVTSRTSMNSANMSPDLRRSRNRGSPFQMQTPQQTSHFSHHA